METLGKLDLHVATVKILCSSHVLESILWVFTKDLTCLLYSELY